MKYHKTRKKSIKAVSPLIATILLVAVALSIAGLLYAWTSRSATETTQEIDSKAREWLDCDAVSLYIDYECSYDKDTGLKFIVGDNSSVNIDDNITVAVITANNDIVTSIMEPNFNARMMQVNSQDFSNSSDFLDLATPLKKIQIYIDSCPNRKSTITKCD